MNNIGKAEKVQSIYGESDGLNNDMLCGSCEHYRNRKSEWCIYKYKCVYSPIPTKSWFMKVKSNG